ncbi:MAG: DUF6514 family protein [Clostridia bacterium]
MKADRILYGEEIITKEKLIPYGVDHPIKLEYYFVISKEEITRYGAEIVKKEILGNSIIIEGKILKNLTTSQEKAERILKILRDNRVTPFSLEEIIEDLIQEKQIMK